jgi:hypothetical protein
MVMLLNLESDNQKYKRFHNWNIKLGHLTYEEAEKVIETLDENLITQREYENRRLSEDLARDSEDINAVQDYIIFRTRTISPAG